MTASNFICALLANLMSGIIIEHFEPKSEMTIPLICVVKGGLDVVFCMMSYFYVPTLEDFADPE
jgi:hypothetical protein